MFFNKKPDTIESLTNACNKKYDDFMYTRTLAHYKSYYEMKQLLRQDFNFMRSVIEETKEDNLTLDLLKHFKEQLIFINKNPFSCNESEMAQFMSKNYPYQDKVLDIIKQHQSINTPHRKPKF